jgi:pimeloyl-ACP methyl ester carboxylesterase
VWIIFYGPEGGETFTLPRPPWPELVTDEQWAGLRVPCLFLVGENEKIYSAKAAVRRLNRCAPQVKTEVLRGAGHDLAMVNPDLVTSRVLEFLAETEGVGNADPGRAALAGNAALS